MELTIFYIDGTDTETIDVDKVLAPTDVFLYWTLWYPESVDAKIRVRFIPTGRVKEVEMLGESEEERPLASVTSLRKVEDNFGTVPQD